MFNITQLTFFYNLNNILCPIAKRHLWPFFVIFIQIEYPEKLMKVEFI
jgi:hypothetical protein